MAILTLTAAALFALCPEGPRTTCVVDGDTFWLSGEKIRIADINAPETHGARCADERARGNRATARLIALLNAGRFEMESGPRTHDRYGRRLVTVSRGGRSLGMVLVSEGLAETWKGRRSDWCEASPSG
ncbi:MAG: thermonuclease family protein [Novosphingobium sp.]